MLNSDLRAGPEGGMNVWSSSLTVAAGLFGAAGIAAAAVAAHGKGGSDLSIAANFLIVQAAAICAIALSPQRANAAFLVAATLIALGVLLFCGDLSARALLGGRLFPLAAPAGGLCMIAGWVCVALAGALAAAKG
jgi:uncharacterized membrane protein YgdD (TMEM256/DUF423 family)